MKASDSRILQLEKMAKAFCSQLTTETYSPKDLEAIYLRGASDADLKPDNLLSPFTKRQLVIAVDRVVLMEKKLAAAERALKEIAQWTEKPEDNGHMPRRAQIAQTALKRLEEIELFHPKLAFAEEDGV